MDPDRLGTLIDRHAPALELYARQWCGSPDAQDVVQEAFLKLASRRARPDNPAAWLFRVVRNGAIKAGLAAQRRRKYEASAAAEAPPWFVADPDQGARADTIDPDSAAEALRGLPLEQREIIVAHLWGGLTFEQVADVAGCSSSTAHRLYQSGLKTLRDRLGVTCPKTSRPIRNPT
jgi:RNA polymerase sigma-70 factor (ECF subfamily)